MTPNHRELATRIAADNDGCSAVHQGRVPFICCLSDEHDGDHIAYGFGNREMFRWPREESSRVVRAGDLVVYDEIEAKPSVVGTYRVPTVPRRLRDRIIDRLRWRS